MQVGLKCEQSHIFDMKTHLYLQHVAVCDIKTRKDISLSLRSVRQTTKKEFKI